MLYTNFSVATGYKVVHVFLCRTHTVALQCDIALLCASHMSSQSSPCGDERHRRRGAKIPLAAALQKKAENGEQQDAFLHKGRGHRHIALGQKKQSPNLMTVRTALTICSATNSGAISRPPPHTSPPGTHTLVAQFTHPSSKLRVRAALSLAAALCRIASDRPRKERVLVGG